VSCVRGCAVGTPPLRTSVGWLAGALFSASVFGGCTGKIGVAPGSPGSGPSGAGDVAGGGGNNGGGGGGGGGGDGTAFVAFEALSRRLSQAELDATARDLFLDSTSPASHFIIGDDFTPYDNDYTLQTASRALVESLEVMATDVGARLVADAGRRANVLPCAPTGPGDAACFRKFVQTIGKRALRRPLADDEIAAYTALESYATEQNQYVQNDFYTAVALVVQALLQDPEVLYRIEAGTLQADGKTYALDSYQIAARMSYLLWGTTPDDPLLADADAAKLTDAAGRRAQAERMLQDPRAKSQIHRFHAMWLGYRAIPHSAELVAAFEKETNALIDRVIFDRKESYLQLFLESETYLDPYLADHYQLPHPQGAEGWVPYPDASRRAGILSHGSVLSAFSKFTDTSPTQRGILVRNRLMCQRILPPPPTVNTDRPPGSTMDAVCKKDRYLAHTQSSSCHACHGQMDPIGFGLENFDIAGVFRTHDDGLPQCTIDGQGDLPGYGTFSGPKELAQKLVQDDLVAPCAARNYVRFAIGREPASAAELARLDAIAAGFAAHDHSFESLILDFIASDAFGLRLEPEGTP
jgi:uncharacterized protein DUF1588/uncharacterized protein DUF1592/uncharacterized protein DUF1595/uncharacterized protein DUF1585